MEGKLSLVSRKVTEADRGNAGSCT